MHWFKLPVVDRFHPASNKFVVGVENTATGDSKVNDNPGKKDCVINAKSFWIEVTMGFISLRKSKLRVLNLNTDFAFLVKETKDSILGEDSSVPLMHLAKICLNSGLLAISLFP